MAVPAMVFQMAAGTSQKEHPTQIPSGMNDILAPDVADGSRIA